MSNEQGRRQQEIERLQKLWKELTEKLNALQRERNFETRIEEKLRLGKLIDDTREDRAQIDNELHELESNFGYKFTHSIPDNHLEAERAVEAAKTSEIINTAQHNPKKQAKQYEKELEKIEDQAEVEKKFVRAPIDDYDRSKEFKDNIAKSATKAVDNVADNIKSPVQLEHGAQALINVQNRFPDSRTGAYTTQGSSNLPQLSLAIPNDSTRNRLLNDVFEHLEKLICQLEDKNIFLSYIFHYISEAFLGEKGDSKTIDEYSKKIQQWVLEQKSHMRIEEFEFFQKISSVEKLKDYLK